MYRFGLTINTKRGPVPAPGKKKKNQTINAVDRVTHVGSTLSHNRKQIN